ncbi:MAG TPA: phosphoribosylformylglycinamidine synthase subunit PurL [Planctomycetota bacterium]|nr:phosphoribosylformylglycinamidine synthase subunit PurL [Planctomycetota bacterium]
MSNSTQGFWEVEVSSREGLLDPRSRDVEAQVRRFLGAASKEGLIDRVLVSDVYYFEGESLTAASLDRVRRFLLSDPATQVSRAAPPGTTLERDGGNGLHRATVLKKPGVMDPVEASLLVGLEDLGIPSVRVRTATRYAFGGTLGPAERRLVLEKVLSNPVIEAIYLEEEGAPRVSPFGSAVPYEFQYREVPLEGLEDEELRRVSREGQLSLALEEMLAVRDHFRALGRAPSDAELETLAQTWSEHCCHKTFTGLINHVTEGPGLGERSQVLIDNLLRETIRKATEEIAAPWCLSVFVDNAGAIAFDDEHAVTFKVETHNHPSAIEPYGGAGTGLGGVLRDTLGTGLGAKPIVNTDVFCFGPPDLPMEEVPPGALHPLRTLRGVVAGVRDYGNRMGIPTASGAVCFDRGYVGNPLVFCGSVGIIPLGALPKKVSPGDRIYVLGGRTGRDGIHGATFSSLELSEESERLSSGAVQIGNAITEKKLLEVLLAARDRRLFSSVTDCGAGGLSSAVGEMGAETGARVELDRVPLKYEGLGYWEIWISEAQERMVLSVPPDRAPELEALASAEDVECTDIGELTDTGRLVLEYSGRVVCDLSMKFLHEGRPRWRRPSVFRRKTPTMAAWVPPPSLSKVLRAILASPNVASKEWIIRQYDHEVQGGSILKPLQGAAEDGPGDGVAFTPRLGSNRGIVIGCGINPLYGEIDPYRMAESAVDEAVRNVVAAGGDPARTALLDNFCWGNTDRPETLGTLVEAARGCHDAAVGLGTPFISGKDSLNNEYRAGDRTISIPPTLLISSLSVVEDVRRLVSMDLKEAGSRILIVGETLEELGGSHLALHLNTEGGVVPGLRHPLAARIHRQVHAAIREGLVASCHDLSEGGLGVAIAEMAFAGGVGAEIRLADVPRAGCPRDDLILFSESNTRYLLEVRPEKVSAVLAMVAGLPAADIGETVKYGIIRVLGLGGKPVVAEALEELKKIWKSPLAFD